MQDSALKTIVGRKTASLAILCTFALLTLPPTALSQVGVITRVSTGLNGTSANGGSGALSISADGCAVVFGSDAPDLVPMDLNGFADIFVFSCDSMTNFRASLRNGGGEAHMGHSTDAAIMGTSVRSGAFASAATDIVANDMNGVRDIFVVAGDVENGTPIVTRVSVPNLADQGMLGTEANASSNHPSMGGGERFVAFESNATNLVLGDTLGHTDIFVHDRQTGATTRVSLPNLADQGMLGTQGNNVSVQPVMSANGRFVAFESLANNLVLGDTNNAIDVFVHDRQTGATERVSLPNLADQGMLGTESMNGVNFLASISADGRFVSFQSNATNLVLNDAMGFADIFVHDRMTHATTRVSLPNLADQGMLGTQGNGDSVGTNNGLSFRGRYVAFRSAAPNLVLNDNNGDQDIFVHDRQTGLTRRVSVNLDGSEVNGDSEGEPAISADGRFVAFDSSTTFMGVGVDDNLDIDAFLAATGLTSEPLPVINNGGVVNAASFAPGAAVAPGSIVGVFGSNLAEGLGIAGAVPLPTVLSEGSAIVEFDNGSTRLELPLFFVSLNQINAQVPFETPTGGSVNVFPVELGTSGTDSFFNVVTFAPGIFTTNQQGTGQGAILNANTSSLAAPMGAFPGSQPAPRGGFLEIYWTGGGPVTNQPATGAAAGSNPLSATTTTPTLTIGGVPTPVLFSGLAPGFVGLYVTTCQVPAMAPIGDAIQLVLTQGGVPSNTVTIAIAAP